MATVKQFRMAHLVIAVLIAGVGITACGSNKDTKNTKQKTAKIQVQFKKAE